jgi:hypothetical protein
MKRARPRRRLRTTRAPAPLHALPPWPWAVDVIRKSSKLDPKDAETDRHVSPGKYGNNPLGSNDGKGRPVNPVTGQPYAPRVVQARRLRRVLAEFWADGPKSETPPGHWNVLANQASSTTRCSPASWKGRARARQARVGRAPVPRAQRRACTTRPSRRGTSSARSRCAPAHHHHPLMPQKGQSSDPRCPSYSVDGLPLEPGLIELITAESSAARPAPRAPRRLRRRARHQGLARRARRLHDQLSGVGWVRAPSGCRTRSATSSRPRSRASSRGTAPSAAPLPRCSRRDRGSVRSRWARQRPPSRRTSRSPSSRGPASTLKLQWASWYDAADQAGQSRLWGGIHIEPDDFVGRRLGALVGTEATAHARKFFDGTAIP